MEQILSPVIVSNTQEQLLSVVIPVYNEEDGLPALFARLYPALDALAKKEGLAYEIVFINDGSRDRSAALLAQQYELRPEVTKIVLFNGNFGQHMAIMAGFEHSKGNFVITLDADLQNPPEEIANLVRELLAGHDYVGSIRMARQDSWFRRYASKVMNRLRDRITRITMTDQGCMLRAYDRRIVNLMKSILLSQHWLIPFQAIQLKSKSHMKNALLANLNILYTNLFDLILTW